MTTITSEQVRAARALIRWEQKDLAEASGVSLPSIKRLETQPGALAAQPRTVGAIRKALESAGVIFVAENGEGAGVRTRKTLDTAEAITRKIEALEAKAADIIPGDGPPSPSKAMKTMKRAVLKNEARKLKGKLARSRK